MLLKTLAMACLAVAFSAESASAAEVYPFPTPKPAIFGGSSHNLINVDMKEPVAAQGAYSEAQIKPAHAARHTMCGTGLCPGFLILGTAY